MLFSLHLVQFNSRAIIHGTAKAQKAWAHGGSSCSPPRVWMQISAPEEALPFFEHHQFLPLGFCLYAWCWTILESQSPNLALASYSLALAGSITLILLSWGTYCKSCFLKPQPGILGLSVAQRKAVSQAGIPGERDLASECCLCPGQVTLQFPPRCPDAIKMWTGLWPIPLTWCWGYPCFGYCTTTLSSAPMARVVNVHEVIYSVLRMKPCRVWHKGSYSTWILVIRLFKGGWRVRGWFPRASDTARVETSNISTEPGPGPLL